MKDVAPEMILQAVADRLNLNPIDLTSRSKRRNTRIVAEGKQITAYLMRMHTDIPLKQIALALGFTDKQYATHCINRTITAMSYDTQLCITLKQMEIDILQAVERGDTTIKHVVK